MKYSVENSAKNSVQNSVNKSVENSVKNSVWFLTRQSVKIAILISITKEMKK